MANPYVQSQQYVNDLVLGLFHHFPSGRKQIRYERQVLDAFLHEKQTKFPKLLGPLIFYNTTEGKRCVNLEQAIRGDLRQMGVLGSWTNTNIREFIGNPSIAKEAAERIDSEGTLSELSEEFQERFAVGYSTKK